MTHLIGLMGVVIISFSAILVRLADVSPSTAAFFRGAYAIPALFIIWRVVQTPDQRSRTARWIAFVSGFFLAVDLAFWHRAIDSIGAGLGTVLGNTQVVFVGVMAWLLHRERPNRQALLTIPVVFAGAALISGLGRADAYGEDPLMGVIYGVLTGAFFGGFILMFRVSNRGLAPVPGPLLDATLGLAVGSLPLGLLDAGFDLTPSWPAHGWLAALALGSQVVGWLFISYALPRLPALETSVQLLIQPMLTLLWGSLIFGEHLSSYQWIGVVLVLGGVGTLSIRGSIEKHEASESPTLPVSARAVVDRPD